MKPLTQPEYLKLLRKRVAVAEKTRDALKEPVSEDMRRWITAQVDSASDAIKAHQARVMGYNRVVEDVLFERGLPWRKRVGNY